MCLFITTGTLKQEIASVFQILKESSKPLFFPSLYIREELWLSLQINSDVSFKINIIIYDRDKEV